MRILLKSGSTIEDSSCDIALWRERMRDPGMIVQYSAGNGDVVIFPMSEIGEIQFSHEDIEKKVVSQMNQLGKDAAEEEQ